MNEVIREVLFDGVAETPLSQNVIDYLMAQKRESSFLDFKKILNISKDDLNDFPKLVKDAMGFANNGGGYILIGFQQNDHADDSIKSKFVPVGIPDDFNVDQASLQEKINSFLNTPLSVSYLEFAHKVSIGKDTPIKRNFAIIYFPPSPAILMPVKDGDYIIETKTEGKKSKKAFKTGDIIIRRGTQNAIASQYEIDWISRRVKDHNYRLSVLSGQVDEVEEILYSNLFELTQVPTYIWRAATKYDNYPDIGRALRQKAPNVSHYVLRCKLWGGQIVSFTDLSDRSNAYHSLIREDSTPSKEPVSEWLSDEDKKNTVIELIKKEIYSFANVERSMFFDGKTRKLYYPALGEGSRSVEWPTRYKGVSKRIVSAKMYSPKLGQFVYWHVAVKPNIHTIGHQLYLSLYPTMVITSDGRHPKDGPDQGAVITSLQYDKYNSSYMNTILFWAKKLSNGGEDIMLDNGLKISATPVETTIGSGIRWDIPTTDLKEIIENYDEQLAEELEIGAELEGDGENEF